MNKVKGLNKIPVECRECGEEFVRKRPAQFFCSHECATKNQRRRHDFGTIPGIVRKKSKEIYPYFGIDELEEY